MNLPISPVAVVLSGSIMVGAAFLAATPAFAQPPRCLANGNIVTLEGVASAVTSGEARPAWVLHLNRPACVVRRSGHAPVEQIFAIRIIGTPPPLHIPLQLTGKLLLGGTSPGATMFAALAVISGRKERTAESLPPQPRITASVPVPSVSQPPETAARCASPPYGGTQAAYQSFVKRFGPIIKPQKILSGVCNAKFGNTSRDGLHKLGFSDAKIQSENTEQLAAETIVALKKLVNTIQ